MADHVSGTRAQRDAVGTTQDEGGVREYLKHLADRAVTTYTRGMSKRGYSRDFTPAPQGHAKYLLDKIPVPLWRDVRAKAKREGVSLRALILKLLTEWLTR